MIFQRSKHLLGLSPSKRTSVRLAIVTLTLVAGLLRFPGLNHLPPGLYHDEAYNGLDALAIGQGHHAIFFEANNGREPLHLYLMSLTVHLFGRTPTGVRAAAALLGTLLVPLTFLLAKEMFDERVGLWAALLVTSHPWLLCLSRTGFRSVSLAVVSALGLTALWRGLKTRRQRWFVVAGALIGLTQYTYTSSRFVPIALGLGLLLARRRQQALGRYLVLLVVCMALVSLPLIAYALGHPVAFLARPNQISILNPNIHQGRLLSLIGEQILKHLGALFLAGDVNPRHNVPGKPILDPLASLLFAIGLAAGFASHAKSELVFMLGYVAAMLLPGVLATEGPNFLRLSGVLPLILLPPALGADWLWRRLQALGRPTATFLLAAAMVTVGVRNALMYYVYYTHDKTPFYQFEVPSAEIAAHVNRFLGPGYVRDDLPPLPQPSGLTRSAYVADELLRFSKTVTFLLQPSPHLHSLKEAPTAAYGGSVEGEERLLLLLPNSYQPYLDLLPSGQQIKVHVGSTMQGEFPGDQPFLLYVAFAATRPPDLVPVSRFEGGISLLDYRLGQPEPGTLQVKLRWRADRDPERDYTVFVHLLQGDSLVSQHDGPPACGYYPTSRWRAGDVIVDTHPLDLPADFEAIDSALLVGLYRPEDLTRLRCTLVDGQTRDSFPLSLSENLLR